MTIYVYSNETGRQVASHSAENNVACEQWAEENYGSNDYHWSYADGAVSNAVPRYTAEQIAEQIANEELTIEQAAKLTGWPIIEDCLVPEPSKWHADSGDAEVVEEHKSGKEAAQAYVDDVEWGERDETSWVTVDVWRAGIDENGEEVEVGRESHKIELKPIEPKCIDADGHDWQSPYSIVGGINDNPGMWGHGGGVTIDEVCIRCGCGKTIDTWAQDPADGQQGLMSVSYGPGKYADKIKAEDDDNDDE